VLDATMYKDSGEGFVKVLKCRGPELADPCVSKKKVMPNGDFRYRILWSGIGDPSWRPQ
jgi:hypothetical protein